MSSIPPLGGSGMNFDPTRKGPPDLPDKKKSKNRTEKEVEDARKKVLEEEQRKTRKRIKELGTGEHFDETV